jgi:NAD(P)-dependent dehydrogenase (short-subunit alcohol dehydrogenase family)
MPWTLAEMPTLTGRTAIVTGATSGLGLETARELARAGAHVVLAARNAGKAETAMADIARSVPGAVLSFESLDLASLNSVRAAAARIASSHPALDLLINNAGVMAIPRRMLTEDGFEMQLGSNFLGHFALTMRLAPALLAAPAARVVSLGSMAARAGRIDFDDPQLERGYTPWRAYCQSKLACLMFAVEFGRRATAQGWNLVSAAAHPGWSVTNLQSAGPSLGLNRPSWTAIGMRLFEPLMAQNAAAGALPTLMAAVSPAVRNGDYCGPDGMGGLKGAPIKVAAPPTALNEASGVRLWTLAEKLTCTALPD